jgi:hypothetical protein
MDDSSVGGGAAGPGAGLARRHSHGSRPRRPGARAVASRAEIIQRAGGSLGA